MVEAIQELSDKNKNHQEAIVALQEILNNTPAGAVKPSEQQPNCTSVQNIQNTEESHSIETASEPLSGRLETISNTNAKDEASVIDNQTSPAIDKSMLQDRDGDGLVDGLDNKTETRAETARRLLEEAYNVSLSSKFKLTSILNSQRKLAKITDIANINDQIGILSVDNKKKNGAGNLNPFPEEHNDQTKPISGLSSMDT